MSKTSWLIKNDQVGPYVIVRRIGKGGMGEVYEAFDESLRRHVALKFMPRETADNPEMVKRFEAEGRALALVRHVNTVGVYTVGKHLGVPYISMEYVEGAALNKFLQKETVSLKDGIEMFFQLLEGTKSLHEHGLIHRDLKPANIIKQSSGRIRIVDFGIAKVVNDSDYEFTEVGAVLGSVKYMAPEVARGEPASVKSDIRSLGIIFYELLTGRYPFNLPDNQLKMLEVIRNEDVVFPTDFTVPTDMKRIILKMCQKSKALRYDDISEVIDDISRFKETCAVEIDAHAQPDFDKTVVVVKKDENRVVRIEQELTGDQHQSAGNAHRNFSPAVNEQGMASDESKGFGQSAEWSKKVTGRRKSVRSDQRKKGDQRKWSGSDMGLAALIAVGLIFIFMEFRADKNSSGKSDQSLELPGDESSKEQETKGPVVKKDPPKEVPSPLKPKLQATPGKQKEGKRGKKKIKNPLALAPKNLAKLSFPSNKFKNRKVELVFKWMGKVLGGGYDFQLATDAKFKQLIKEKSGVSMDPLAVVVPKGRYYWRVKANDKKYISSWSAPFQFDVLEQNETQVAVRPEPKPSPRVSKKVPAPKLVNRDMEVSLNFPTQRSPAQYAQTAINPPKFKWRKKSLYQFYEFEVASDIAFRNSLMKKVTRSSSVIWKSPKPGLNFWRVKGFSKRGLASPNSEIGSIRVQLPPPILPNSLSKRVTVKDFNKMNAQPILFRAKWSAVPLASGYSVEISETRDFLTTFYSEKVSGTSLKVELPPANKYYLKIAALDDSYAIVGRYSPASAFSLKKVFKPPRPRLLEPIDKRIEQRGAKLLLFKWNEKKGVERYEFQIAKDRGFKDVVMNKKLILTKIYLRNPKLPSTIYWRVRAYSKKSRSKWSRSRIIQFK